MTHLTEAEFIDLAENEGALDSRRAAHVEACASCREQLEGLRSMLRETAAVGVPEPSPLFWEHLSARVRDGIAAEPAPARSGWNWIGIRGLMPLAGAAAMIVAVLSGVLLVRSVREEITNMPATGQHAGTLATNGASVAASLEATPDDANAEVWAVLTAAASDVAVEDARAAGMHVLPATIDHAVQDMTEAELTELGRLLQSELKRSSN